MLKSVIGTEITVLSFFTCMAVSLILGIGTALVGKYKSRATQSFLLTASILPAVVSLVIMLVNGNIGAGVAVAGAFGLVRFRSVAGSAREIGVIFLGMAIGLACGMGYIGLAVISFIIIGGALLLLSRFNFGGKDATERILKITIPENLNYDGLFDDLFEKYAKTYSLDKVKTSNMGTLYELSYRVTIKDGISTKELLDDIRCRNGNLNIVFGREADREAL